MTDGNDDPSRSQPTFQETLWPDRISELNAAWSAEGFAKFLHEADAETRGYDEKVAAFIAALDPDDPNAKNQIAAFISRVELSEDKQPERWEDHTGRLGN